MLAIFYFIISWTFNLLLENKIQIIIIIITITIIIIIIIELTHSKTILEKTLEIEPLPVSSLRFQEPFSIFQPFQVELSSELVLFLLYYQST